MKTVAVSSRLAGGGKSTLACQIAAAAQALEFAPVVVVDTARAGTAFRWGETRGRHSPVCVRANADRLPALLDELSSNETGLTVIDTAPFQLVSSQAACAQADLVLVPVSASIAGVEAARKTVAALRRSGTPALIVINGIAAPPDERLLVALGEIAPLAPAVIRHHALFADCLCRGTTVFERDPFGDVTRDVHELWTAMAFLLEASDPPPLLTAAE